MATGYETTSVRGTQFAVLDSYNYSAVHWVGSYEVLSQDPITNKSVLRLYGSMWVSNNNSAGYGSDNSYDTLQVNGVTISPPTPTQFRYNSSHNYGYRVYPGYSLFGYTDLTVTHNADGTFPAQTIGIYGRTFHFNYQETDGTISNVPALDRTAPTVTTSLASRGATSLTINCVASSACELWEYSVDGGAWTQFSTTNATAVSCTIDGLVPTVSYAIRIRARKTVNHLTGTSSSISYTTLGATNITAADAITADASTVLVGYTCEVYNETYTYSLAIKRGSTTLLTLTSGALSKGTHTVSFTLTSAQQTALLNGISDVALISATFELTSLNNGVSVGATTTTANITTSASRSAPNAPTFTYADVNTATVAVTGDNQKLIQGMSSLSVQNLTATAKNGASIASYTINVGGVTKTSASGGTVSVGAISQSGALQLTVTAVDTRGYSSSRSVTVQSIAYTPPSAESLAVTRENGIDALIDVVASGTYTATGNNALTAQYQYKKTSEQNYSALASLLITYSDGTFTVNVAEVVSLDPDYSYNFRFILSDSLNTETYAVVIAQGIPLLAFRKWGLGVNKVPESDASLSVKGLVRFDGEALADFIVEQGTSGIWTYRKWNSGIAECWGTTSKSFTGWQAWDGLYEGTPRFNEVYPSGLFNATPVFEVTPYGDGNVGISGVEVYVGHSKDNTPYMYPLRPSTGGTATVYFYMRAIGRWK